MTLEIVKVSDRLAKEEAEIDEQLEVIKEQLMQFSDVKHAIESGARNKDIRRMVQTIDTIEISTRDGLNKKSEYKYYDCEEVDNRRKQKYLRACPKTDLGKTERIGVALLNGQPRVSNCRLCLLFSNFRHTVINVHSRFLQVSFLSSANCKYKDHVQVMLQQMTFDKSCHYWYL